MEGTTTRLFFRLVTLGSDVLQSKGYTRIGQESVVAAPCRRWGLIVADRRRAGGGY